MIVGAGVQPEAAGAVAHGFADDPLQKVSPETATDEFRHKAELLQFD